jgi:hypothetical protein
VLAFHAAQGAVHLPFTPTFAIQMSNAKVDLAKATVRHSHDFRDHNDSVINVLPVNEECLCALHIGPLVSLLLAKRQLQDLCGLSTNIGISRGIRGRFQQHECRLDEKIFARASCLDIPPSVCLFEAKNRPFGSAEIHRGFGQSAKLFQRFFLFLLLGFLFLE